MLKSWSMWTKDRFCKRSKPWLHCRMIKGMNFAYLLSESNSHYLRKYLLINVNDRFITPRLDTGSNITLISWKTWHELGLQSIHSTTDCINNASGIPIKTGLINFIVKCNDLMTVSKCYVTDESFNLLGLDWIPELKIFDYPFILICNPD